MNKKNKNIKFIYHNELAYRMNIFPKPSKNFIPEWYKKILPYEKSQLNPTGKKLIVENKLSNASAKKCIPMLDSITCGYIVPLWCDVQVRQEKNWDTNEYSPRITWRISKDVFQSHQPSSKEIPPPFGYSNNVFKFITYFRIKTPKKYSILVNSPIGHNQLPFHAIPAIIDSDKSVIDTNFPCWVQEGFEGIVEKGTPMAQIFPFKRNNWDSKNSLISFNDHAIQAEINFESNIVNNYQKNIWFKKEYN